MKSTRLRFPKKNKNKVEQRQLITQDDYYDEATDYEEQAERWLLSDIKKSLRFYVKAFELYNHGLSAECVTEKGTYNIYYNQTRLLLQIYTDYLANNGYINVLQYVNLDDIPNLSSVLLSLPQIIEMMEVIYNQVPVQESWDLQFNLLTAYAALVESQDKFSLNGEEVLQLTDKFIKITQNLMKYIIEELSNWSNTSDNDEEPVNKPVLSDSVKEDLGDSTDEIMEVSDQITTSSLEDVIANGFKFSELLIEQIIDDSTSVNPTLNLIQINYLKEIVDKFILQLNDVVETSKQQFRLSLVDINLSLFSLQGVKVIESQDMTNIKSYVTIIPQDSLEVQLLKIDLLQFVINLIDTQNQEQEKWKLTTLLNSNMTSARTALSTLRSELQNGNNDRLSRTVFQLCDIYVNSSDNELTRWIIKNCEPDSERVQTILMKNAKTHLTNAMKIAEKPCGLQENIVDKLKRNFIFNQAKSRLTALEVGTVSPQDATNLADLIRDHPFYRRFIQ